MHLLLLFSHLLQASMTIESRGHDAAEALLAELRRLGIEGRFVEAAGRIPEAIRIARSSDLDPMDAAQLLSQVGFIHHSLGLLDTAVAEYRCGALNYFDGSISEIGLAYGHDHPDLIPVHLGLAIAYNQLRQWDRSSAAASRALELAERFGATNVLLGRILEARPGSAITIACGIGRLRGEATPGSCERSQMKASRDRNIAARLNREMSSLGATLITKEGHAR